MSFKKILFLGGLSSGGAEHQMVIIATLLKQQGHDVSFFCGNQSDFFQKDLERHGILIIRLKASRIASILKLDFIRTTFFLQRLFKINKYDTVISFIGDWNFQNCLLANRQSTRHKAITGIRNNRDNLFLSLRERFYTYFEKNATYKVSNSEAAKERYSELFPHLRSKLITIYNIVNLPLITSSYSFKNNGRISIIVPASYREVKNPMRLLEAISIIPINDRERLRVDWYGDVKMGLSLYHSMRSFISVNHLGDVVTLHDATPDIANRINEADIVGLFSTSEGLPNSICEGMMLGKPIIMTRVSDYEILVSENNGFLCDATDVQSIAETLSSIVHTPADDLLKMGIASKKKALSLFSSSIVLEKWNHII